MFVLKFQAVNFPQSKDHGVSSMHLAFGSDGNASDPRLWKETAEMLLEAQAGVPFSEDGSPAGQVGVQVHSQHGMATR